MGQLNPEIILGVQQPKLTLPDPVEQYSKALTIKTLLGQQDLQGLQISEATRKADAERRIAALFSGNPNASSAEVMGIDPVQGLAFRKAELENLMHQSTIGKNQAEIPKIQQETSDKADAAYRNAWGSVTNPQQAAQLITAGFNNPILAPRLAMSGTLEDHLARIPNDPQTFGQWVQHITLGGAKYAELNKPHITSQNLGGTEQLTATPGLGGAPTVLSSTPRTATPGERMIDARTRERLAYDQAQPKGQVVQTEQGIMLADPRAGTAQPMLGPDGQPLERPLKAIPPSANTGILENANNLRRAEQALALVEGKTVNTAKGSTTATGFKGYLPGAILNRTDPTGVETRAAIADLGSLIIHERSGAAVTASESPRLVPFIPQVTDDHATVVKKLRRFTEIYRDMAKNLDETYSKDQGYRPNPVSARSSEAPTETAKPTGGIKFLGFE
jgi:hypothetical protein